MGEPIKKLFCGREDGHTPTVTLMALADGRWSGDRDRHASMIFWKQYEWQVLIGWFGRRAAGCTLFGTAVKMSQLCNDCSSALLSCGGGAWKR